MRNKKLFLSIITFIVVITFVIILIPYSSGIKVKTVNSGDNLKFDGKTIYTLDKSRYVHHRNPDIFEDLVVFEDTSGITFKEKVVYEENRDIYLWNLSSGEVKQITTNIGRQTHPSIYENKIVYYDYSGTTCTEDFSSCELNTAVNLYDLDSGEHKQIFNIVGTVIKNLDIEGDYLIWEEVVKGHYIDIFYYDLKTEQIKKITPDWEKPEAVKDFGTSGDPHIYKEKIVYTALYGFDPDTGISKNNIYIYDIQTEETINLFDNEAEPPVQLTGAKIYEDNLYWYSKDDGNFDIYKYNLQTREKEKVVESDLMDRKFDISDDQHLFFTRAKTGADTDLYLKDLETDETIRITNDKYSKMRIESYGDFVVWHDLKSDSLQQIYVYKAN